MSDAKPRRVKAKITRTVTEIAIILLDKEDNVEEVEDILEEIDSAVIDLHSIITVISAHG